MRSLRVFLRWSAIMGLALSLQAFAQDRAKSAADGRKPVAEKDKVDITDIEQKYWAPKDTDFNVVQNRTYSKEKRFSLGAQYGTLMNDPYSNAAVMAFKANYFWSERYGVEVQHYLMDPEDNDAITQLRALATGGAKPNHNKIREFTGLGFNWVPFYAKMSFMGKSIIYFDMIFTPVLGTTSYDQQTEVGTKSNSAFTYGLDISQLFFFSKHFAIRFDWVNRWYQQEVIRYRTGSGGTIGSKLKDENVNSTNLLLGVTYFF